MTIGHENALGYPKPHVEGHLAFVRSAAIAAWAQFCVTCFMKVKEEDRQDSTVAAVAAPEDSRRGDFVAVLSEVVELPSFLWCDVSADERGELVRMRWLPTQDHQPLKIKQICLPFVFVKTSTGTFQTIDIRLTNLARLDRSYAKAVTKALRSVRARGRQGC